MATGAMERVLDHGGSPIASAPAAFTQTSMVYGQQTPNRKRSQPDSANDDMAFPFTQSYTSPNGPPNGAHHLVSRSLMFTSPTTSGYVPGAEGQFYASPATALAMSLSASTLGQDGSPVASMPFDIQTTPTRDSGRPELKRRKTAPPQIASSPIASIVGSSSSPASSPAARRLANSPEKKAVGKDGAEVWPADVEDAFFAALRIVPKLGRRKVMVNNKPCGRNELIADYIQRKTGKSRSRKQVSSHIQVLKNIRRDDAEFMNLVAEPMDGDEIFTPEAIEAFGGTLQINGTTCSPTTSLNMTQSLSESLAASIRKPPPPPFNPSVGMYRSLSMSQAGSSPSPMPSPAISDNMSLHSSIGTPGSAMSLAMSTNTNLTSVPMSSGLSSAFKEMQFPFPAQSESNAAVQCPIFPYQLCMWAEQPGAFPSVGNEQNQHQHPFTSHVYARLDKRAETHNRPRSTVYLEDLASLSGVLPQLVNMHNHLPCQFLHIKLDITMPKMPVLSNSIRSQLCLSSTQDIPLTAVTTIYFGDKTLTDVYVMNSASRLDAASNNAAMQAIGASSTTSSPASPDSPQTPNSTSGSPPQVGPRHKYGYTADFVPNFWSGFLDGNTKPSVQGLVMLQEFVVKRDGGGLPPSELSPGSKHGDVVLVVVYEVAIAQEASANGLGSPIQKTSDVAFLSLRPKQIPVQQNLVMQATQKRPGHLLSASAPLPRRPSTLSRSSSLLSTELSLDTMHEIAFSKEPVLSPMAIGDGEEMVYIPTPVSTCDLNKSNLSGAMLVPEIQLQVTSPTSAAPSRMSRMERKPNLSLRIPTPGLPTQGETPPITPLPQMVHTPNHPPPMLQPASPSQRMRLHQNWASQSSQWNLDSPALLGNFTGLEPSAPAYTGSLPTTITGHNASAALNSLTASAIEAGTPTYPFFNMNPTHDLPFVAMPHAQQHNSAPLNFDDFTQPSDYFSSF